LNFAHVAVMHDGNMLIVPCDCHRVPTRFSYLAAIVRFALPANAVASGQLSRIVGSHLAAPFEPASSSAFAFFFAAAFAFLASMA
jgi:hypothetical protein